MKRILSLFTLLLLFFGVVACQTTTLPSITTLSSTTSSQTSTTTTTSPIETTTTTSPTTTLPSTTELLTTTTPVRYQTIEIFSVNDLHGLAYFDSSNFQNAISAYAKLGRYILAQQARTTNTLFIANGDILQGSAFSNYYYGLPMIESLNAMNLDAFVIGNHEFDWGIDKIENYKDQNPDNGEANYPFLAANIVNKTTKEPMPWTQPYLIKTFGDVKVGVIGLIGDVYTSIAPSRVAEYEFLDYVTVARQYTYHLRVNEGVDIVIVSVHGYDISRNQELASYRGDYLIDAVINAHTHSNVSQYINRTDTRMPYVQTNATTTNAIGKITLTFDLQERRISEAFVQLIGMSSFSTEDSYVRAVLDTFANDPTYVAFTTEVLSQNTAYANTSTLAVWGASVIRDYMQVDIGILNSGGFRKAMPLGPITMGFLVEVYPFDNYMKIVNLTGAQIIHLAQTSSLIFDDSFQVSAINSTQMYRVATVDYVFDQDRYPFLSGQNIELTDILLRNLLIQDLRKSNNQFNAFNGTSY